MSEVNVIEGNKSIAIFMGGKYKEVFWGGKPEQCFYMPDSHISEPISDFENSLPYYTDWNLLMPVVEKIGKMCFFRISMNELNQVHVMVVPVKNKEGFSVNGYGIEKSIDYVYKAVLQFITWYNNNSTQ
jgi:hypothetical protein